jgi:hypothetical protein
LSDFLKKYGHIISTFIPQNTWNYFNPVINARIVKQIINTGMGAGFYF